ncbi:hypothetical protein BVY03_00550, partial [bacterium K02(2017)]
MFVTPVRNKAIPVSANPILVASSVKKFSETADLHLKDDYQIVKPASFCSKILSRVSPLILGLFGSGCTKQFSNKSSEVVRKTKNVIDAFDSLDPQYQLMFGALVVSGVAIGLLINDYVIRPYAEYLTNFYNDDVVTIKLYGVANAKNIEAARHKISNLIKSASKSKGDKINNSFKALQVIIEKYPQKFDVDHINLLIDAVKEGQFSISPLLESLSQIKNSYIFGNDQIEALVNIVKEEPDKELCQTLVNVLIKDADKLQHHMIGLMHDSPEAFGYCITHLKGFELEAAILFDGISRPLINRINENLITLEEATYLDFAEKFNTSISLFQLINSLMDMSAFLSTEIVKQVLQLYQKFSNFRVSFNLFFSASQYYQVMDGACVDELMTIIDVAPQATKEVLLVLQQLSLISPDIFTLKHQKKLWDKITGVDPSLQNSNYHQPDDFLDRHSHVLHVLNLIGMG